MMRKGQKIAEFPNSAGGLAGEFNLEGANANTYVFLNISC